MGIRQQIDYLPGLLTVEASGEFSLKEAKQAFLETLAAVAQYRAEKVLVDARKVKGRPGDHERFLYGEFAARETMNLVREHKIVPRFAYVLLEPLRDPERYGETVARNRGMKVKVCETPEEAFRWLGVSLRHRPSTGT
jgi:hypothetical protein